MDQLLANLKKKKSEQKTEQHIDSFSVGRSVTETFNSAMTSGPRGSIAAHDIST